MLRTPNAGPPTLNLGYPSAQVKTIMPRAAAASEKPSGGFGGFFRKEAGTTGNTGTSNNTASAPAPTRPKKGGKVNRESQTVRPLTLNP